MLQRGCTSLFKTIWLSKRITVFYARAANPAVNNFLSLLSITCHVSNLENAYIDGLTGQKCLLG